MTDLPPFDPTAVCPKCGGGCPSCHWFSGSASVPECHVRICLGCNYVWLEAPLDATPPMNGDTNTMIDTQTQPEKQIEQLANYLLDKWSAHIRCGGAVENAIAILDQYATPAAAGHDDDEPDDAYLAAKLASGEAETPDTGNPACQDVSPPASSPFVQLMQAAGVVARRLEHSEAVPAEERESLLAAWHAYSTEPRSPAEPSIPVSRIVAVLAERYETSRKLSMGEDYHAPEHTSTSAAREIEQVAHQLGISEQWRTEWKRQRLEAE